MVKKSLALPGTNGKEIDDILNDLSSEIDKEFGAGSAVRLNSASTLSQVDYWCSSRSIVVDAVLAGGRPHPCSLVPFGRQTEISGEPGVGKSSLCAQIAAECQKQGGIVIATDTEERIAEDYWTSLGVDTSKILNVSARSLEEVFEKQIKVIETIQARKSNVPALLLWDSVGSTSLGNLVDFEPEGANKSLSVLEFARKGMASKARTIGAGMEIINTKISKSRVAYVYTNHLYSTLGQTFGDGKETPGGAKLKYFATVRLRLKMVGEISEEDSVTGNKNVIGQRVRVTALKNSMAPVRKTVDGAILGGKGWSDFFTVKEVAESLKLITKAGAWSTCKFPSGKEVKYQGLSGFEQNIVTHPEYGDLFALVVEAL